MSEKIAIGVIGTGNMGRNHVRVLQSMQQDYEFIGIYDADERRAATIADVYDTVAFTQLDALLERVDAVSIAVPSFLHKEIALQAAAAGCHVMLEKPIALNVKDAQAIIQACQQAGVLLMVGHVERFNPAIMELMKVIENEEIISLDFKRMSPYDPRIGDANVVQDLMIHDIDILNAIMGDAALQRLIPL